MSIPIMSNGEFITHNIFKTTEKFALKFSASIYNMNSYQ